MFTGIVREVGNVVVCDGGDEGMRLQVDAPTLPALVASGDSVAVNGACLTITRANGGVLEFDVVPETVRRTTLGRLTVGRLVNLEPALRAGDPLGGHIVQGHVDGVGRVRAVEREGDGKRLELEIPAGLERYCVEKGSITVEGVSLTIAGVAGGTISIALVPHTLAATTLGALRPGDEVNVEVDVLAKYVERLLEEKGAIS